MIEWWQALLISLPSAILGGLVVGCTALIVQSRQLSHDASMQAQRLAHERSLRRDDALRAAKRDRLQPVFELLVDIDKAASRVVWQNIGAGLPDDPRFRELAQQSFPGLTEAQTQRIAELVTDQAPEISSSDLVLRTLGLANRLSDKRLAADIMAVVSSMRGSDGGDLSRFLGMPDIHARLEAEATRIDDQSGNAA